MRVSVSSTARWSPATNSTKASAESSSAPHQRRPALAPPARPSAAGSARARSVLPAAGVDERAEAEHHRPRPRPRLADRHAALLDEPLGLRPSCPARNSANERCACRSARQSSSPRTRYHSSSTAWRARAASKSSIEWKWISGIVLFGASGPAFASSSRQRSSSSGRGRSARRSPAQNRSDADRGHRARRPLGIENCEGRVGTLDPPAPGGARRCSRRASGRARATSAWSRGLGRQRLLEARGRAFPRAGDPQDLAEQGARCGAQVADRRARGALGKRPRAARRPRRRAAPPPRRASDGRAPRPVRPG